MPELSVLAWVLLATAAVLVGLTKTGVPAVSTISIAVFAAVLPARESTGTLLLLLIVADAVALLIYRRHANWRMLLGLVPAVVVGIAIGIASLAIMNDLATRVVIAVILLAVVGFTLGRRWLRRTVGSGSSRIAAVGYGVLGGFTTMVANAGGPVMTMYFLASRLSIKEFLGTAAWFFALVNLSKLPASIALGLITPGGVLVDLVLVPAVLVGAVVGRWLAQRLDQVLFERLTIVFTLVGVVSLLWPR